jgi:hypothetical protein
MTETIDKHAHAAAAGWFEEPLSDGEWVSATWISRQGEYELRMIDIVGSNGRHRVLIRYQPDGGDERWDDLEYEDVMLIADRLREVSLPNGYILWDFAGPAVEIPGLSELRAESA